MSTRSVIVRKTDNGYQGIYCHSDGYPEHTGRILTEHYTEPAKIAELMAGGFLSWLGPEIGESNPHNPTGENDMTQCSYYARDWQRPIEDNEAFEAESLAAAVNVIDCAWVYVFEGGAANDYASILANGRVYALAHKLVDYDWTGCTAWQLDGVIYANDSTGPDGAQEYAAILIEQDGRGPDGAGLIMGRQVETITFSWCTVDRAAEIIRQVAAGVYGMDQPITLQVDGPGHECPLCA
jgi:hypothetical protein